MEVEETKKATKRNKRQKNDERSKCYEPCSEKNKKRKHTGMGKFYPKGFCWHGERGTIYHFAHQRHSNTKKKQGGNHLQKGKDYAPPAPRWKYTDVVCATSQSRAATEQ